MAPLFGWIPAMTLLAVVLSTAAAPGQDFPDDPPRPTTKKSVTAPDPSPPSRLPEAPTPAKLANSPPSNKQCPEGPPEAILKYMEESLQVVADDSNPAEVRSAFREAFNAILTAGEKVLKHPKATETHRNEAYQFQASILYQGARKGELGYADRLDRLAEKLYTSQPRTDVANLASFLSIKARYEDEEGLRSDALPAVQEYLKRYPREEAAIELLVDLAGNAEAAGRNDVARQAYTIIQQSFKRHEIAAKIPAIHRRLDLVGKKLNLEVALTNGNKFSLDDQRRRVVVVLFWATWCERCVQEQEILKDLYGRYKADGLEVVGVPLDDKETTAQQFLKKHNIPWLQAVIPFDPSDHGFNHPIARQFGILQLPTIFVVEEGKVVATQVRGSALKRRLEDLMTKPSSTKITDRFGDPPPIK